MVKHRRACLPQSARRWLALTPSLREEGRRAMSTSLAVVPFSHKAAIQQRVALTEPDAIFQANGRLSVIRPLLDYRAEMTGARALRLKDGSQVTSFTRMVEFVSENSQPHVSTATLFKWLAAFREGGLPALADKTRADKGKSRALFDAYPKAKFLAA